MNKRCLLLIMGLAALALASCQAPQEVDLPVTIQPLPSPTLETFVPTPLPPEKTLIVCMEQEPLSLFIYNQDYLYGETGREANTVLQAIYDGPFNTLESGVEPVILKSLPSFDAGTARFETVEVGEYEVFFNPQTLQPDNLRPGDSYLPSGCHSPDCIRKFEGGTVSMDHLVVEFELREDVTWSDGVGLTSGDSVYSYTVDRAGSTPTAKYMVDRTSSYVAIDDWKVRWTSIPGYSDLEYQTIFWHPLPRHVLGELSAEMLQSDEGANTLPVGWGPYKLESRVAGDRIEAIRNPFYFRKGEGLPYFDRVVFRFIGSDPRAAVQQLLTTECDVLDESSLPSGIWSEIMDYQEEGRLQILRTPAAEVIRLDFNTAPIGRSGEAFFQTAEMRQAVAACLDRERLTELSMAGLGSMANSFHNFAGLQGLDLSRLDYNPDRGRELIRFLGWVDEDEDPQTPQSGWGVPGVYNGKRLAVTLLTVGDERLTVIAGEIQSMLFECGIQVDLELVSTEELTGGYPDGLVFGRDFDMVLWSWPDWRVPLCEMFSTREIPKDGNPHGVNGTGYSNPTYDQACDRLLLGDPEAASDSLAEVQTIFIEELPALPLVQPPRLLVTAQDLCGLVADAFSPSLLWAIESVARGEGCKP